MSTLMNSELLNLQKLEIRRLWFDLIWCFEIVFDTVRVTPDQFFEFRVRSTSSHPFKLYLSAITPVGLDHYSLLKGSSTYGMNYQFLSLTLEPCHPLKSRFTGFI